MTMAVELTDMWKTVKENAVLELFDGAVDPDGYVLEMQCTLKETTKRKNAKITEERVGDLYHTLGRPSLKTGIFHSLQ